MPIQDALEKYFMHIYGASVDGSNIEEVIENSLKHISPLAGIATFEKVAPYFYEAEFKDYSYEHASKYYEQYIPKLGGCSVIFKNGLIGRNYDWQYDRAASFLIRTPAVHGRHRVTGIAVTPTGLTSSMIERGKFVEAYTRIPFMLLDGINDEGLFCEVNVVPSGDKGITTGTNPGYKKLFAPMIPRVVLDYADSIDDAISILNEMNVYAPHANGIDQEYHFMLAQGSDAVMVEFVNNELKVIDSFINNRPIATNFYLDGWDGTKQTLTPYSQGVERYNILNSAYTQIDYVNDMFTAMGTVKFTKAYLENTTPTWYSEFVGKTEEFGDLTINSDPEDFAEILAWARNEFQNRSRNGKTWQTVHSAVYDLSAKTIGVKCQEEYGPFNFTF